MRITSITIKNYRFATIVFLLLTIVGVNSFISMPRAENPEITVPAVSVFAVYPGTSPSDLEQLIAQPIENALKELEDIKRVSTIIRDGLVVAHVEFYFGVDSDEKYDKVLQQINATRSELPKDLYSLETMKWRVSDVVLMQLAFTSATAPYNALQSKAELLEDRLKKVADIRKMEILAYPEQEVRVKLDMEKMASMQLSTDDVAKAIQSNNANIPGGSIDMGTRSFGIKTSGAYNNLEEIRNTVVSSHKGRIVRVENIAQIEMAYADRKYIARHNGTTSVFMAIYQKENKNVFETTEKVNEIIAAFRPDLDQNIELNVVFNQAAEVKSKISSFQDNLFQGIILVGILIFLSLGIRSSLLVIIAIPLSLIMGLFAVDASGYALEQMTIAGLVIALGLLVDNSIVMTEAINRYIGKGHSPKEAAILSAKEIGWPIITSTLTTVLVFVPIITMPDKAGVFIRSMPFTIIATLSFSLLLALTLTPLLASKLFKGGRSSDNEKKRGIKKLLAFLIENLYRQTIVYALKKRWLVLLGSFIIFAGTLVVAWFFLGISFFPKAEKGQFMVRTILPEGSNLEATSQAVDYVESVLQSVPDVEQFAGNIGHGNPRIYYNVLSRNYQKSFGEVFVQLKSFDTERFAHIVDSLRHVFSQYTGAKINITEFEQSPPVDAPIMVYITGDENDKLRDISNHFESLLLEQPGIINLENSLSDVRTDLFVNIHRDKANMLGIPIHEIDRTIRTAIAGIEVDKFNDDSGEEYGIILRRPEGSNISMDDFRKIYVKTLGGKMVPLMQVADLEFRNAPSEIRRFNYERTSLITAELTKGTSLDEALNPVIEELEQFKFPENYGYYIGGELESRKESFGGMQRAVVIAILMVFAVLVLQFNSYTQPLIIFTAIPLAVVGSIYALLLAGQTFSFTAFIGLTSLIGIVINNAIMLVDYTNWLRKEGVSKAEALRIAGETRFTPIILTTLTTAGGLLPLTLQGGDLWAPMGWTIIGGLLVSTFLTLLVVPVLYSIVVRD